MSTSIARAASTKKHPGAKVKHPGAKPQPTPIEPDAFYRAHQVAQRWGVHVMTIWLWSKNGTIPAPVQIGPNVVRWRGSDVLAHEQSRRAAR